MLVPGLALLADCLHTRHHKQRKTVLQLHMQSQAASRICKAVDLCACTLTNLLLGSS